MALRKENLTIHGSLGHFPSSPCAHNLSSHNLAATKSIPNTCTLDHHPTTFPLPPSLHSCYDLSMTQTTKGPPMPTTQYRSRAAQQAVASGYGSSSYAAYLDQSAQENADYYTARNQPTKAAEMFTRSLSDALRGNDGI